MPLNERKPHGTVHGIPGVAYEQDGKYYDNEGRRCDLQGKHIADDPAPKRDPLDHDGDGRKGGSLPRGTKTTEQVGKFEVPADLMEEQEPPDDFIAEGVNLSAYARGEEKVQFFKVAGAVQKAFGTKPSNGEEVMDILRREGIAPKAEEPAEEPGDEAENEAA